MSDFTFKPPASADDNTLGYAVGQLPNGIRVGGQLHRAITLRPAMFSDTVAVLDSEAAKLSGPAADVRLSAQLALRQVVQIGELDAAALAGLDVLALLTDDDWAYVSELKTWLGNALRQPSNAGSPAAEPS